MMSSKSRQEAIRFIKSDENKHVTDGQVDEWDRLFPDIDPWKTSAHTMLRMLQYPEAARNAIEEAKDRLEYTYMHILLSELVDMKTFHNAPEDKKEEFFNWFMLNEVKIRLEAFHDGYEEAREDYQ